MLGLYQRRMTARAVYLSWQNSLIGMWVGGLKHWVIDYVIKYGQ